MRFVLAFSSLIALASLSSCATYRDELFRAQQAYENNQHERTLALLRDLEPDVTRLTPGEQAQYAYLRGMTDYRIGYKNDARHWLAIARAFDEQTPGIIPTDWKQRTTETLAELDGVVQTQGYAALSAPPPR
jgi:lipoprotein NlpI